MSQPSSQFVVSGTVAATDPVARSETPGADAFDIAALSPASRVRRLREGFRIASWDHPARLSESSQDALYTRLIKVSTRAFGADMTPYWRDRRAGGYFQQLSRFVLLMTDDNVVVGWTGFHRKRFGGRRCLFLDSTGVVPE